LLVALERRTGVRPHVMRIGVDESHDQWGICELREE
jgi:hypothetical protein